MKPTFHHRLINGPFGDPCLYVRLLREKRALMFDIGEIFRLDAGDLLKVSDLFVTHMHIDHFVGFDTLLRMLLRRPSPLRVFGPRSIIDCVEGKLKGYEWNLIEEYPITVEVFEVSEETIRQASFHSKNYFRKIDSGQKRKFDGMLLDEGYFRVRAAVLSHGIPSLGYCLEEDVHINIDKAALTGMGVEVGPWLAELKEAIRGNAPEDTMLQAGALRMSLSELKEKIVMITKGQKLSYVADSSPDDENVRKIANLAKDSDTLYSEAYFLDEDMERAINRNHLTARLAGKIAREAGVKNLSLFHFSPKYRDNPQALIDEAMGEWKARS